MAHRPGRRRIGEDHVFAAIGTAVRRPRGVCICEILGEHFGSTLYAREVDYLMAEEWAHTADDVLWRRTKLGLRVTPEDKQRLAAYMAGRG